MKEKERIPGFVDPPAEEEVDKRFRGVLDAGPRIIHLPEGLDPKAFDEAMKRGEDPDEWIRKETARLQKEEKDG